MRCVCVRRSLCGARAVRRTCVRARARSARRVCPVLCAANWQPARTVRGLPRWCDRFSQYGIKVSFWASGTLKIVIYVENYPEKRCFRLADYHPLWGWGVLG